MDNILKNIAPPYDITKSYEVGNYCIFANLPLMCVEATSGEFDASKWKKVYLSEIISGKLNSNIYTEGYDSKQVLAGTETAGIILYRKGKQRVVVSKNTNDIQLAQYQADFIPEGDRPSYAVLQVVEGMWSGNQSWGQFFMFGFTSDGAINIHGGNGNYQWARQRSFNVVYYVD